MKKSIMTMLVFICIFSSANASDKPVKADEIQMQKAESTYYNPVFPVSLIGTKLGEQVNFMTAAWFTRLEVDPYLFGVSIQKQHFTHKAIMENNCFSINIPTVDMIPRVDAVGMVSGKAYDKSKVFDVFYGDNEKVPMVDGSVISFECEVVNAVSLVELDDAHPRAHTLFIAEVKNVWVNKNGIKDQALDYETLKPILWTFSPRNYWTIGEKQGPCFNSENIKLVPKKN